MHACEFLGGGGLWLCLLFLTESKWRVCTPWQGMFHQTYTNCGKDSAERHPHNAECQLNGLRSYLTYSRQTSLIWIIWKITWSNLACWKQIQHCFFFHPELLKAAEPFSPSTCLVFSSWYESLEFWKGTVVHTNSSFYYSPIWTNLSSFDSGCIIPAFDCWLFPLFFFIFLSLIQLFTHRFIHLFIFLSCVSGQ